MTGPCARLSLLGAFSIKYADMFKGYGESQNTSGIYGTIAVIFLFQGFYAFSITPMTSLYPTEVSSFKLRATGIAIFRMLDSGFGYVLPLHSSIICMATIIRASFKQHY